MVAVNLQKKTYDKLIEFLKEKFYETTDLMKLAEINQICKELNCESMSWLVEVLKNE